MWAIYVGVAHRDLKHSQVLFSKQGECLLSDFDCASARPLTPSSSSSPNNPVSVADNNSDPAQWRLSDWVGSPAFMAPEVGLTLFTFFNPNKPSNLSQFSAFSLY